MRNPLHRRLPRLALVPLLFTPLLAASLLPAAAAAQAAGARAAPTGTPAGAAELAWYPVRPAQGTLFVVRAGPAARGDLTEVTGVAAGETLRFHRLADGSFESLAPVPVDAGDALEVRVELVHENGTRRSERLEVPVAPGSFQHEELTVAPEYGSPLSGERRARLARDRERARSVSRRAGETARLWSSEVILPRDDRVTSGFGNGRVFNGQVSSRHMGLDLDGEPGDTIVAPTRGVVALVDDFLLAGRIVYLNHGGNLVSGYFHLSEPLVAEGDTVEAGTPIGRVGATGRVTGPHLHWVVRYGSTSVDPRSLLEVAAGRD